MSGRRPPEPGETVRTGSGWSRICRAEVLTPDRGVAALVEGRQVAIFALAGIDADRPASLHAIDNHDPHSGANVLARGLVGSTGSVDHVASPIHKHRYDLRTGACLDGPGTVAVHDVRTRDGWVEVCPDAAPTASGARTTGGQLPVSQR